MFSVMYSKAAGLLESLGSEGASGSNSPSGTQVLSLRWREGGVERQPPIMASQLTGSPPPEGCSSSCLEGGLDVATDTSFVLVCAATGQESQPDWPGNLRTLACFG